MTKPLLPRGFATICVAFLSVLLFAGPAAADEFDWPNWRGPNQNCTSSEVGLVDSWDPDTGENLLWKRDDLATRSTPIVMAGKLYVQARYKPGTPQEGERVICVSGETGETIWESPFNVYLSDVPDTRVAWSSVCGDPETGNIYALGVCGLFQCFDGQTGKVLWSRSLHEEFGLVSTYGGRTHTPAVFEDMVLVSAVVTSFGDLARPAHRIFAMDKRTGELRWLNGTNLNPPDTTYSNPVFAKLAGLDAMTFGSSDGAVWAFQPRTGKPLWNYPFTKRGINSSVTVDSGTVYATHAHENVTDPTTMGAVAALDEAGKEKWRFMGLMSERTSPLIADGKLYVLDDGGGLWVIDPATGKQIKGNGRRANIKLDKLAWGNMLYADGKIYVCTTSGRWFILKPDASAQGVKKVHELRLPETECTASLVVSRGRIYLATGNAMYCIGKKDHKPALSGTAAAGAPAATVKDDKAAQVQVVPYMALVAPGKSQKLAVRLYNAQGELLNPNATDQAQFTVEGGGTIEGGVFTAAADAKHYAVTVKAKAGDVTGESRLRIVPPLSWKWDFEDEVIPATWVGMRNRHIIVDGELLTALEKEWPTRQLYVYLTAYFTQSQGKPVTIGGAAPNPPWAAMLKYFDLGSSVRTLADAKKKFEPGLKRLQEEGVLQSFAFAGDDAKPQLAVVRGPRKLEGRGAMLKLDRIPTPRGFTQLGAKSRGWLGSVDLHDYTIQADFQPVPVDGKLPDFGVIAQRYSLSVLPANKKLRITAWDAQPRIESAMSFTVEPGAWYSMKLTAANEGDKAVLRGKMWKRGQSEPKEWMLTLTDTVPNRVGAPGFVGNTNVGQFAIDNVSVTPNKAASE
ncbi:MAG: PQQ-like beta-propeller repeat protein [Planctomycetia bacterium]|nr:PQQ-like beta-propeller repeat protein [Planctomycetia bacterium]